MSSIFYEKFTIDTELRQEEILQRLSEVVETDKKSIIWPWTRIEKPYQGKIYADHFQISRIISYRNSMLPIIEGKILLRSIGCSIDVTMRLHDFIKYFLIIFFAMFGSGMVLVVPALIKENGLIGSMPLVILVVVIIAFITAFNVEANIARKFLINLFR